MPIRTISAELIEEKVLAAIAEISFAPDKHITQSLSAALEQETNARAIDALSCLLTNIDIAQEDRVPLCQDTGTFVVFAELGCDLHIEGGVLSEIINIALAKASKELYLRASILTDPLKARVNTQDNTPAIVHTTITQGNQLKLILAQKGGGAENMSRLKMFTPSAKPQDIVDFVVESVILAGAKACPPLVIGIGIGGNFETCAILAKKALFIPVSEPNNDPWYADLEQEILRRVNDEGCGVQGIGGKNTALAVHILTAPCHIASLPVAVNLQCHAHRQAEITI